ncbi:MAG: class I SAM-dependent methyltransferase [Candidatus Levybacteria bacterium]|nr:class I SAM-dependent methyltransferase [Candidatus Levybacteria bacterium]
MENLKLTDYSQIAPNYDSARPLRSIAQDFWVNLLSSELGGGEISLVDIGCGNGRFAVPLAQRLAYEVVGVDNSRAMLELARKNDLNNLVKWSEQDASRLGFKNNSFNSVWISHLLHLVNNPINVLTECFRVLKPNGKLIIRYTTREDNSKKPERHFFPELLEQDKILMPKNADIVSWFKKTKFTDVLQRQITIPVYNLSIERVEKAKQRAESGFARMSNSGFQCGIVKFEAYANSYQKDPWILNDNYSITTALKNK